MFKSATRGFYTTGVCYLAAPSCVHPTAPSCVHPAFPALICMFVKHCDSFMSVIDAVHCSLPLLWLSRDDSNWPADL